MNPAWTNLPLPRRIWWPWDQPVSRVGFWTDFELRTPTTGDLFVAASGGYAVWLDGRRLSPPDAHAPSWRIVHRMPVVLAGGRHRLSIEARPGAHGQPFLLACLDWTGSDATVSGTGRVATSSDWRMAAEPPEGWHAAEAEGDPPGAWQAAWAFDGVWAEPWGIPCNVPEDWCRLSHGWQTVRSEVLIRVAAIHTGLATAGAAVEVEPSGRIRLQPARPDPPGPFPLGDIRKQDLAYRSREAHSHILNQRLELFEARAPHVVFDVGAETFGRVRVRLQDGGPALLAVTTGESEPELHKHLGRVSDVFCLRAGESFATGPTGFRYVKVTGLGAGGTGDILLDPIRVQHIRYPVEPRGRFACDDEVLNGIWALSARTVHLCMQNEIWDGIKRDQLPWMGDLYTEALAIYHAFGDARLARWSLGVLGELGPVPDRPLRRQRYPGLQSMWKRPGTDINGIPSYTLWWLVGLADYWRYTGDRTLLEDLAAELEATVQHVASWVDRDGGWRHRSGWDYVDWAPLSATERAVFCHLLAYQALGLGSDLLVAAGQAPPQVHEPLARMRRYARDVIWRNGETDFGAAHHVPAMLIRSGCLDPLESRTLFQRTLRPDPPLRMTFWHRFADLEAAALVGEIEWGRQYLRRHWGAALDLGMTTLWEAFDPTWDGPDPHAVSLIGAEHARYGGYETSLCHGWSAGPAAWLHRAVLGVKPLGPGFEIVEFQPALGALKHAEGTVPTPRGAIVVGLQQATAGSRPVASIAVPAGVSVRIPEAARETWEIKLTSLG